MSFDVMGRSVAGLLSKCTEFNQSQHHEGAPEYKADTLGLFFAVISLSKFGGKGSAYSRKILDTEPSIRAQGPRGNLFKRRPEPAANSSRA
jgi:hypothetical protein